MLRIALFLVIIASAFLCDHRHRATVSKGAKGLLTRLRRAKASFKVCGGGSGFRFASWWRRMRPSTARKKRSGLGLDAPQTAVQTFIASKGADARLVTHFTEVESGK
jgi:hypothetical protein